MNQLPNLLLLHHRLLLLLPTLIPQDPRAR